jgi:hypothetical protein
MVHCKSLSSATIAALGVFTLGEQLLGTGSSSTRIPATGLTENGLRRRIDLDGDWDAALPKARRRQRQNGSVNQGPASGHRGIF